MTEPSARTATLPSWVDVARVTWPICAVIGTRVPVRSTTMASGCPAEVRIFAVTSLHRVTGSPATSTIVSPVCRPAATDGAWGSPTTQSATGLATVGAVCGMHWATVDTVGTRDWTPMPDMRMVNMTKASTRFISGPPSMTVTFLGTDSL